MLAHAIVSGRVQGVGFRFMTQQHAQQYHLNGWVQNQTDGTVALEVEGDEQQVQAFLQQLKGGFSTFIHVENVDVTTQQENKGYQNFSIR